ncbi:ABC transporter ATP-binding protein [Desulfospira joergensenii]|uniref:ABC transporter ATP-binding protein n=1 Tax=Desulfospira joergensenii TaxID=53329 RepID=UPI0003B7845F|nr:ABC transporter ATP-binding protein [Desulfospira joergensenii]
MKPILEVKDLSVTFQTFEGKVQALDQVSFDLFPGETLGIVGESGCGKSVTSLSIMRLIPDPPGKVEQGKILLDGKELLSYSPAQMRKVRGNRISMIFQEPMTSLSPVFTVKEQIAEVFRLHQNLSRKEAVRKSIEMLERVNIPDPAKAAGYYPHQMSGGMRQRVMIAMALACKPDILIADEPTTALDVTIQAQVIDQMKALQQEMGMSVLFITHDLGVIAHTAKRVIVMYVGRIFEQASAADLFAEPLHPYTRGLMESIPKTGAKLTGKQGDLQEIKGVVPSLLDLPQGCKFCERCPEKMDICAQKEPELIPVSPERSCRCWLYKKE